MKPVRSRLVRDPGRELAEINPGDYVTIWPPDPEADGWPDWMGVAVESDVLGQGDGLRWTVKTREGEETAHENWLRKMDDLEVLAYEDELP